MTDSDDDDGEDLEPEDSDPTLDHTPEGEPDGDGDDVPGEDEPVDIEL